VSVRKVEGRAISCLDQHVSMQREPAAVGPVPQVLGHFGRQGTLAHGRAQTAGANLTLHGLEIRITEGGGMKAQYAVCVTEHPIGNAAVQMGMRSTIRITRLSSAGSRCRKWRRRLGNVITHCRTATLGNT
jgi:hypothetical protein